MSDRERAAKLASEMRQKFHKTRLTREVHFSLTVEQCDDVIAALDTVASLAPTVAGEDLGNGLIAVPRVPTGEMIIDGVHAWHASEDFLDTICANIYRAMTDTNARGTP